MDFKSDFLENLKLLLKGKYVISDEVLITLSDIAIKYDLESLLRQGTIVDLYYILDKYNLKFPLSFTYFESLWNKEILTVDFKPVIKDFMKNKLVSIRKMSPEAFLKASNINKSSSEIPNSKSKHLVVFGSTLLNSFFSELSSILVKDTESVSGVVLREGHTIKVCESVSFEDLDSKYKNFILRLSKKVRRSLSLGITTESYDYDSYTNEIEFNFVFHLEDIKTSKMLDKDLRRIFKKWIKDVNVTNFEIYIDGKNRVFFGITIDMSALLTDFTDIIDQILYALDETLTSM